jgi:hypothetical protein
MESHNMLSKTIGLHKTAFANTLEVFSTMQQHGEDLLKTTLEQSPWLSRSSKNACLSCVDFYSKYLENLKSVADQGFAEIERISSPGLKPEKKESQQTKTTERIRAPRPAKKSPAVRKETVSTKKTEVANTLPDKKPVTQNVSTEKLVTQSPPTEKLVTQSPPTEKLVTQSPPTEKLVTQSPPSEKLVTHEKPEVKKSAEVKAETSIPKPFVASQPTADPALGNKESASKLLRQKG